MLTPEAYQMAWLVYTAAVAGLLAALFVAFAQAVSRRVLLGILWPLAVTLLTPVSAAEGAEFLAPALIVGVFEWLSIGEEALARSLRPIGVFLIIAVVLEVAYFAIAAWFRHRRRVS